jgi:hypothetical protein
MLSFTLRTSWKKPETLQTLMVRRRVAGIVRPGGIGLVRKAGVKGVRKVAAMGVGTGAAIVVVGGGGMDGTGIVDRARR